MTPRQWLLAGVLGILAPAVTWAVAIVLTAPHHAGATLVFERSEGPEAGVVLARSDLVPLGLEPLFDAAVRDGRASALLDDDALERALQVLHPDSAAPWAVTVEGVRLHLYYLKP